jgi:murein DD-endopeptidase MepM/ murein hydrolase activator NlpD
MSRIRLGFTAAALLLALAHIALRAEDTWYFLKDGRVGLGNPLKQPLTIRLADGSEVQVEQSDIGGTRTVSHVNRAVDAMLMEMARGRQLEEHGQRFAVLREAAVPRLLYHLKEGKGPLPLCALFGLQYCWSPAAKTPVEAALRHADPGVRQVAIVVLQRHLGLDDAAKLAAGQADDPDFSVAGMALPLAEKAEPDPKRILRFLTDRRGWPYLPKVLAHHRGPEMTAPTLTMLGEGAPKERRAAAAALIAQQADTDAARTGAAHALRDDDDLVRARAAEFLAWYGNRDSLNELEKRLAIEKDAYVRASLEAALRAIVERERWRHDAAKAEGPFANQTTAAEADLDEWATRLPYAPLADWERAEKLLRAVPVEPYYLQDAEAPGAVFLAAQRRNDIWRAIRAPWTVQSEPVPPQPPALAERLVAPVAHYFDRKRKSYGTFVTKGIFQGSVHVGDDIGHDQDYLGIYSIAAGQVKSCGHAFTWGYLVVIEHRRKGADGQEEHFCSLYGHLSPLLHVKEGDVVQAGQLLGTLGRGFSVENGGYPAHLHFGIRQGPFQPAATVGYVSKEAFNAGTHGWVNPQAFLKPE